MKKIKNPLRIAIIGSGNLAIALAGEIRQSNPETNITIVKTRPKQLENNFSITSINYDNHANVATDFTVDLITEKYEAVSSVDMIFITVPKSIISCVSHHLSNHITPDTNICIIPLGSLSELSVCANIDMKDNDKVLFGFDRIPYICRLSHDPKTGKSSVLSHRKQQVNCFNIIREIETSTLSDLLNVDIVKSSRHILSTTLTNSNPLLHTSRLFDIHLTNSVSNNIPNKYFYADWSLSASVFYSILDRELQHIIQQLNIENVDTPTIYQHYGVSDDNELTKKLKSIQSLSKVLTPFTKSGELDTASRYFTEDFLHGLFSIVSIADVLNVSTPFMRILLQFGQNMMLPTANDKFIKSNGELLNPQTVTGLSTFNIFDIKSLYKTYSGITKT